MAEARAFDVVRRHMDLWLFGLALVLALLPFGRSLLGMSYLGASLVAVGAVAAVSLAVRAWPWWRALGAIVVVSLAVWLVVVVPETTTYGVPGPRTWRAVGHSFSSWWRDFLTAGVPSAATDGLVAAPVWLGLVGAAVTSALVLRTSWYLAPAVPPLVVFALATALSPGRAMLSVITTCALAAVLLSALVVREAADRSSDRRQTRPSGIGVSTTAAGSLALAVVLGAAIGVGQGFIGDADRFEARSLVDPPAHEDGELSPMTLFRWKKEADHQDDVLFSVTFDQVPTGSSTAPTRLALAYLSSYDGSVWSVSPDELHVAGDRLPPLPGADDLEGESITQHYSIDGALPTSFLPSLPGASNVTPHGFDVAYSDLTGSLVSIDRPPSATYDVTSVHRPISERRCPIEASAVGTFGPDLDPLTRIPAELSSFTAFRSLVQWAAPDVADPMRRLDQLECDLRSPIGGYINNPAARQGHGVARLAEVANETHIGSEEQFAALLALAARMELLPSRVVVGYRLPAGSIVAGRPVAVRARDVTVWPEVYVGGDVGWQPLQPSGAEQDVADQTAAEVAAQPAGGPPPPPRAQPPDPPVAETSRSRFRSSADGVSWTLPIVVASLVVLSAVGTVLAKSWRRRQRRRAEDPRRAALGAWDETRRHLAVAGVPAFPGWTVQDVATSEHPLISDGARADLWDLGEVVDVALYCLDEPPPGLREDAWSIEGRIRRDVLAGVPLHRRVVSTLDPRPLFVGDDAARPLFRRR